MRHTIKVLNIWKEVMQVEGLLIKNMNYKKIKNDDLVDVLFKSTRIKSSV